MSHPTNAQKFLETKVANFERC